MEALSFLILGVFWALLVAEVRVTPEVYEQAAAKCNMNEGIEKVVLPVMGKDSVHCVNGAKFTLGEVK